MKKEFLYGVFGVLAGIIVTALYFQTGNNPRAVPASIMDRDSNQMSMSANMDQHFIEQMIPHHQDAITMVDLALEKAKKPEIKKLAEDIKTTQSEEIVKMQGWYKGWFGRDVPQSNVPAGMGMMGSMHQGMMGDATDIERLKNAPDSDKAFIEAMIPHHQMAVMMATMLARSTIREEMKTLANDITSAQTREIEQMRQWYRDWGYRY